MNVRRQQPETTRTATAAWRAGFFCAYRVVRKPLCGLTMSHESMVSTFGGADSIGRGG
jgi:hypothetical protein